jgi:S1-C subfamily serine protease
MRYLNAQIILFFVALMLSATASFALPRCKGSPIDTSRNIGSITHVKSWSRCKGKVTYYSGAYYDGTFKNGKWHGQGTYAERDTRVYKGNWVNGLRDGFGVQTQRSYPKIKRGIWSKNKFVKSQANVQISPLRQGFTKLSKKQREQIQAALSHLGFYKFTVDGLYGKGTAAALTAYNKQNLNGADLSKSGNVSKLMTAVLALKPSPTPKRKVIQTDPPDQTYKVASGTGFYVSNEGHIITNHHVIDGCRDMKVHSKGKILETIKIADDARNDLALLKIEETPAHVFALSNQSPFSLQEVIVAGFPFGDRVSSTLKFTQGIVSSVAGLGNDYSQIQIDAALQPGNSGGPIIDELGNIVAVAVAKLSLKKILKDYGVVPENTNFGVKASAVKNLMEGNGVPFKAPNTEVPTRQDLSRQATDGTVFLTCWMTMAQIEKIRSTKVLFEDME